MEENMMKYGRGGHMCGQGTMSFAKGTKYEGEWKRGMMCG
jgi:hypothetical protein